MQLQADKKPDNKPSSDKLTQTQVGSSTALQFLDNRPESIVQKRLMGVDNSAQAKQIAQLKTMTDNYDASNKSFVQPSQTKVLQRVINVNGKLWGEGQNEDFEKEYGPDTSKNIVSEIKDSYPVIGRNLTEQLKSKSTAIVNMKDENILVNATLVKQEDGVDIYEADGEPAVLFTPKEGFERLRIAGLINCLGVYIMRINNKRIEAVSGLHFVTPEMMYKGGINVKGVKALQKTFNLVEGDGVYGAVIARSGEDLKSSEQAREEVLRILSGFLIVSTVLHEGGMNVSFELDSEGKGKMID